MSLPPQSDVDQPPVPPRGDALGAAPVPEWPPHLAELIAELESPRAHHLTDEQTGREYVLVARSLATSTGPAREFGLPAITPLRGIVLRRFDNPAVIFEFIGRAPPPDARAAQMISYDLVGDRTMSFQMEVWRERAYCCGVRVYGQVRWHVLDSTRQALEWDGPWPPAAAFKQATAALREMSNLPKNLGGRPPDFATPEEAEVTLTAVVQAIRGGGLQATEERTAEYLNDHPLRTGREVCSPVQVRRYLRLFWSGRWEDWIASLPPPR